MDEWEWLLAVDPASAETERFLVDAEFLKRSEGTQLGMKYPRPIVRRDVPEQRSAEKRREAWGALRAEQNALARERRSFTRLQRQQMSKGAA